MTPFRRRRTRPSTLAAVEGLLIFLLFFAPSPFDFLFPSSPLFLALFGDHVLSFEERQPAFRFGKATSTDVFVVFMPSPRSRSRFLFLLLLSFTFRESGNGLEVDASSEISFVGLQVPDVFNDCASCGRVNMPDGSELRRQFVREFGLQRVHVGALLVHADEMALDDGHFAALVVDHLNPLDLWLGLEDVAALLEFLFVTSIILLV